MDIEIICALISFLLVGLGIGIEVYHKLEQKRIGRIYDATMKELEFFTCDCNLVDAVTVQILFGQFAHDVLEGAHRKG